MLVYCRGNKSPFNSLTTARQGPGVSQWYITTIPTGRDEAYQMSSQKNNYSDTTSSPYFYVDENCALFQYPAIPTVGIPTVPSKKKFKLKDYDSEDEYWCGYGSDNKYGHILDYIVVEYNYDYDKNLPD